MSKTEYTGWYSFIQYCPDLIAAEAVNIGVILLCPSLKYLNGVTTKSNRRVIQFFGGGKDWEQFEALKSLLSHRLLTSGINSADELHHFTLMCSNVMQCTPPRSMAVIDPERELKELFNRYVERSA